jgi:hypothetical protein
MPVTSELEDVGPVAQVEVELVEVLGGGRGDHRPGVQPVGCWVVVEREIVVADVVTAVAGVREQRVAEAGAAGRVALEHAVLPLRGGRPGMWSNRMTCMRNSDLPAPAAARWPKRMTHATRSGREPALRSKSRPLTRRR